MFSIIKTAIITITLSFISGVLLDHYKSVAPRIVCNLGRSKVHRLNNKKTKVYFLTIRNISKKTIHNVNILIGSNGNSFKIKDARITKGLKFDDISENNIYNVDIPFLSKDDEFCVKIVMEEYEGKFLKPSVTIRSPENFKQLDSFENKYENIAGSSSKNSYGFFNRYLFGNKKVVISVITILIFALIGVVLLDYNNRSKKVIYNNSTTKEEIKEDDNKENKINTIDKNINENQETNKDKSSGSTKNNYPQNNSNSNIEEKNKQETKIIDNSKDDKNTDTNKDLEKEEIINNNNDINPEDKKETETNKEEDNSSKDNVSNEVDGKNANNKLENIE